MSYPDGREAVDRESAISPVGVRDSGIPGQTFPPRIALRGLPGMTGKERLDSLGGQALPRFSSARARIADKVVVGVIASGSTLT